MPKSRSVADLIEDVVAAVSGAPRRKRPTRRRSSTAPAPPTRRGAPRKPTTRKPAAARPAARKASGLRKPTARKASPAKPPAARKPAARKAGPAKPPTARKPAARKASPAKPPATRKPAAKPPARPRRSQPATNTPSAGLPPIVVCVSPDEARLIEAINAYRAAAGLPPIAVSRALTQVARLHVRDLALYHPDRGHDVRGQPGNMHSWSNQGPWQPVCYTDDHAYADAMWSKPREISGGAYRAHGYEIAFESSGRATAAGAIDAWRGSPGHSDVVLERGVWAGKRWPALGVGLYGSYAVAWFGELADPQGAPEPCG